MKYEKIARGLMANAPEGIGGLCPICSEDLDGITWAICSDGFHGERCTGCGTLIYLNEKGKFKGNYTLDKSNYQRYLKKKDKSKINLRRNILKIEQERKGFFNMLLGHKNKKLDLKITQLKQEEEHLQFSKFKKY